MSTAVLLVLLGGSTGVAKSEVDVARPQSRVTDLARVMTEPERVALARSLASFERETRHQIAVLTVPTLDGEAIEKFSLRTANAWRIGRAGVDDGILVVLAPTERKVRIEVGKGMTRYVPDALVNSSIDSDMLPAFRAGDFGKGLREGTARLMEAARRFKTVGLRLRESIMPRIDHLHSRPRHARVTVAWASTGPCS